MNNGEFLLSLIQKFNIESGKWRNISNGIDKSLLLKVFEPSHSKKKYFFFWNDQQPVEQLETVEGFIDLYFGNDIIPQDTYLILLSGIKELNESVYKKIIEVEENEFRYKKYVCYYTETEIEELKNNQVEIFSMKENFFKVYNEFKRDHSFTLLYRMIIKIPIIKMNFEQKELEDFQYLYEAKRKETDAYTISQIKEVEDYILQDIPNQELDEIATKLVDDYINKIYGDDLIEYLSK
ncbi:hypothetical protein P6Z20_08610 [Enterococcus faecium]|uniref:ABC-three component system middle component 1 n=1 Tax=Enterococcus faecium TaxID=1352 RepID=UPI00288F8E66|nr:ABC-three component system middle component 1 [Enterococcus faecium]MCU1871642.1 hypothetical protein [Enterococcus faecium]MDT2290688.1 hypothetical protein [Enterococcus faecium]